VTTYLNNGSTQIPENGDANWGTTLNTAIQEIDNRFVYSSGTTDYQLAGTMFHYIAADRSGITTTATNPFGVSPNLELNHLYTFEYYLRLNNSSTGAITLGWAATAATQFQAEVEVSLENVAGSSTSITGFNQFHTTTNKAITGGDTAAIQVIRIRGMVLKGTATARLPLQVSVASGTITPKAGSWLQFVDLGLSTSGTTNITYGDVA
jgi:hypothetical protein